MDKRKKLKKKKKELTDENDEKKDYSEKDDLHAKLTERVTIVITFLT